MTRPRSWLFPALLALLLFLGDLAANFMPIDIPTGWRPWLWGVILLAGAAAVGLAVRENRQSAAAPPNPAPTPPRRRPNPRQPSAAAAVWRLGKEMLWPAKAA